MLREASAALREKIGQEVTMGVRPEHLIEKSKIPGGAPEGSLIPVTVDVVEEDGATVIELHVAEDDMGKVIGRNGSVAKALRTLLKVTAARDGEHAVGHARRADYRRDVRRRWAGDPVPARRPRCRRDSS